MQRSSRMLVLGAVFALFAAPAAAQTRPAPPAPIAPPSLIRQVSRTAPLTFYWLPVSPGPGYRVGIRGGQRQVQSTLVAVRYQFQILDIEDVNRVLYERFVDSTSLLFLNDGLSDPYFTLNQVPTHPLSAGTYYWRVRAVSAGPVSPYSQLETFTLETGVTTNPLHDLGISTITIAGRPIVGRTAPIVVRVSNLGTFYESGASLDFTANGASIGSADIPPLEPGKHADITVVWTPSDGPLAAITAQVRGHADEDLRNNTVTQSVFVASATPVKTTLVGVLVAKDDGFAIADDNSSILTVALLRANAGSKIDFKRFLNKRVEADGKLRAAGGGLLLDDVTALRAATPSTP